MTLPAATEALCGLLAELPGTMAVERLDRVWLFAPREVNGRESGLVVLSLLPTADRAQEQRQLMTIRYEAEPTKRGEIQRADEVVEQGWVPAERIPRLIAGVLSRLRDEAEQEPVEELIGGDAGRWSALLDRLAAG